jgi:hypothetical protein
VQEEHKRFILVQAEECPTSSEEGETCIILHRGACGRGYKWVRERGCPQVSRWECSACVTLSEPSQGPGESCARVLSYVCVMPSSSFSYPRTVPACSFYSLKEVQGYKMLVHGTILAREVAQGPREVLIWWRRVLHYRGMELVLLALWLQG